MSFWPVIVRELRAESRNPVNFWHRVASGAVLTVVFVWILSASHLDADKAGKVLFVRLHLAMLLMIAVLVPSMTSDCIARERREGTLGLLFLTPLSSVGLLLGKCLVRAIRALSIIVAVMPVMALPLLLGGLTWVDLVSAFSIQLCVVMIALAAGLLASSRSRSAMRSLVFAYVLAGVGIQYFIKLTGWLVSFQVAHFSNPVSLPVRDPTLGFSLLTSWSAWGAVSWGQMFTRGAIAQIWLVTLSELLVLSGSVLFACVLLGAWLVSRNWRDDGPSERAVRLNQTFCTPVVMRGVLKKWLRRKLERNPIGWLEQRRWTGRLVVWSWFAIVTSLYSYMLTSSSLFYRGLHGVHATMAWALTVSVMVTAAGSFRRERETGVMELMLVSPLNEWRIIFGRLRGIWGQFLPAAVLLLIVWMYFASIVPGELETRGTLQLFTSFLCLPVIGLYFSLRCRSFLSSLVLSALLGFVVPEMAFVVARYGLSLLFYGTVRLPDDWRLTIWMGFQVALTCWALMRLHRMLRLRTFSFERLMG